MGGRNAVACIVAAVAASLAPVPSAADESGCVALAESVRSVVHAAAQSRGLTPAAAAPGTPTRVAPAIGGRHTCAATAKVASRAFSEALRGLPLRLAWNDDWLRPGDYCMGHYLDQCYPRHDRFSPLPAPRDFAFASRAWRGVTRALASQMPFGTDGDLSSFTGASLDAALSAELSATFGGPMSAGRSSARPDPGGARRR